ncbi:MAG: hypothetical protein JWR24_5062 [Actinoallomurus sp.]|jgi:uncharacterized membrane protein AbrB (regulator of aidB expression)|nr:hypothetical protein [Actinoallomurus sp.]
MWLNFIFSILASLCVGFILGWIVARPRRWGAFVGEVPDTREDQTAMDSLARGA